MDKKIRFMQFLLKASGADVTAPEQLYNQKTSEFTEVKNGRSSENDNAVNALIAFQGNDKERVEILKIVVMKCFTTAQLLNFEDWLHQYITSIMEYLNEHPECRTPKDERSLLDESFFDDID